MIIYQGGEKEIHDVQFSIFSTIKGTAYGKRTDQGGSLRR